MPVAGPGQDIARILLVDRDAPAAAALAAALLDGLAAIPVVAEARGGRQAVELLRAGDFDLLLVDLHSLGDLGEAAEAVARLVRLARGALVVALSDGSSVSSTLAALSAGAHDHLARPLEAPALHARLGALARRHGHAIAPAFGAHDEEAVAGLADASGQLQAVLDLVARDWPGDAQHLEGLARRIVTMFEGGEAAARPAESPEQPRPAVLPMWQQEQRIIEDAIQSFAGNIALAAAALELSPSTIYRKRQAWAEMDGKKGAA